MEIKLLNKLLSNFNSDGYSEIEIKESEDRIGISFPEELRLIYSKFGKNKLLNCSNYLTPLKKLKIHKEKILFYKENQGSYVWFYKVDEIRERDTNIYQGFDDGTINIIDNNFEQFFIKRLISQCPAALFSFFLFGKNIHKTEEQELRFFFGEVKSDIYYPWNRNLKWFWSDMKCVALIDYLDNESYLRIYSESEEILLHFIEKMGKKEWSINHYLPLEEQKKIISWTQIE